VLPGVGAYSSAMKYLSDHDLLGLSNPSVSILGICLGMQLLFESGTEGGNTIGLQRLHGSVVSLTTHPDFVDTMLLPNVGWLDILQNSSSPYGLSLDLNSMQCYFLHSYYASKVHPDNIKAFSTYSGCIIPSLVCSNNLIGFQFHPEKSGPRGLRLLDQGISYLINR
jgi:glutamine amidotransferase